MKYLIALIFVLTIQTTLHAQNTTDLPKTGIKAAYLGSLIYPGFKIGIERPYKVIQIEKKSRTILKERYWTYNSGFYNHKTFHSNIYLLAERLKRRQYPNGLFLEVAPGIGYSRTTLGGATYKIDDKGEVNKKELAGYNYAMLSLATGIGFDFSKKTEIPIKAYLKPSVVVMAPYNNFVYFRPNVELGVIYSPKSFWKANPLLKIIKRNKTS